MLKQLALRRFSLHLDKALVPRWPVELEINGFCVRMTREQAQILGRYLAMVSDPGEDEEFPIVCTFPELEWPDFAP
jgi:hypothetical protein